jgi:hypothetical protein
MTGTRPYNFSVYPEEATMEKFHKAIAAWKAEHGESATVAHGDKKRCFEVAVNEWADRVLARAASQ